MKTAKALFVLVVVLMWFLLGVAVGERHPLPQPIAAEAIH